MKNFNEMVNGEIAFAIVGWIMAIFYDRIEYGFWDWNLYLTWTKTFGVVLAAVVFVTWIYCLSKDFMRVKVNEFKTRKES